MRAGGFVWLLTLCLAGCAAPNRPNPSHHGEAIPEWQGRISVQVLGDTPNAMSASFLLRGNARTGELDVYSPLGTTVGALQWTPQEVWLDEGGRAQSFRSLAELTEKITGAALPIDALFAWLDGRDAHTEGWQADLSKLSQGSLIATRQTPAPEVRLRIQLER